jgi:hypothetical protein
MTKSPVDSHVAISAVHVTQVDVTADRTHISASFGLGGPVDVRWEGAFTRAVEGKLVGLAKRWYILDTTLIVGEVHPGSGDKLADAVALAVQNANGFVSSEVAEAAADTAAREAQYHQTETAASEAQSLMRSRLKV